MQASLCHQFQIDFCMAFAYVGFFTMIDHYLLGPTFTSCVVHGSLPCVTQCVMWQCCVRECVCMCYSCYMCVIFSVMGFQIEFIFRGDLQRLSQGGCHAQYLGNSVILNFPMCCSLKIDFHLKSIRASLDLLSFLKSLSFQHGFFQI